MNSLALPVCAEATLLARPSHQQRPAGTGSGVYKASSGGPNPDEDKHEPTAFPKETSGIGSTPLIDLLLYARNVYIYSILFLLTVTWLFHPKNSTILSSIQVPWGEVRGEGFTNCSVLP